MFKLRQTEIQRKNQQQKMKASVQSVPTQQQGKVDSRRALNLAALSSTNVNGQPLSSPGKLLINICFKMKRTKGHLILRYCFILI